MRICWYVPRWKRAKRAVKHIREFVMRHTKVDRVVIEPEVNERIWDRGIKKPPRRIKVRVEVMEEDEEKVARVFLAE